MTEAKWLSAADPTPMLKFLKGKASDRKVRLWSCGCIRRIWDVLVDHRSREAIVVAEEFADGRADRRRLRLSFAASERAWLKMRDARDRAFLAPATDPVSEDSPSGYSESQYNAAIAANAVSDTSRRQYFKDHAPAMAVLAVGSASKTSEEAKRAEQMAQAHLVRDIFGNPFRPVTADPAWLTSDVLSLASGIYEERAFDRLPILADALQDAGCDNEDVLSHCRQPGVHVRGCWVVDMLLGKK